jgi:hypothetical protein
MMELQLVDAADMIIVAPMLAGAIRARQEDQRAS